MHACMIKDYYKQNILFTFFVSYITPIHVSQTTMCHHF